MLSKEHTLTQGEDDWFLKMGMKDTYVQQVFQPGDKVVVCNDCKKIWLTLSWEDQNCCPAKGCGCKVTTGFSKKIFAMPKKMPGTGDKIVFHGIESVRFTPWEKLLLTLSTGKFEINEETRIWLEKAGASAKTVANALLILAISLAAYQLNTSDSQINGKSKEEYWSVIYDSASDLASIPGNGKWILSYMMGELEQKSAAQMTPKLLGVLEGAGIKAEDIKEKIEDTFIEGIPDKIKRLIEEIT